MISLKNLTLRNFLSHAETEIEFKTNQKLLVDGNSGSGKSSILEAIIWSLYGTGRSNNTTLVRNGADKAEVILTLEQDGEDVVIHRTISAKGKHTLTITINGVAHPKTGVRDLQDWIETDLTGASYLLFVNSVAYLQGGAENFVTQPAGKRKELLLEIIKTINFDEYYEKVKDRTRKEELEVVATDTTIGSALAAISEAKDNLQEKEKVEGVLVSLKVERTVLDARKSTLDVWFDSQKSAMEKVEALKTGIEKTGYDILVVDGYIKGYEATIEKLKDSSDDSLYNIVALREELAHTESKLDEVFQSISTIASHNAKKMEIMARKPVDKDLGAVLEEKTIELKSLQSVNTCPEGDACPNFTVTLKRIELVKEIILTTKKSIAEFESAWNAWELEMNGFVELPMAELVAKQNQLKEDQRIISVDIQNWNAVSANKQKREEAVSQKEIREKEKEELQKTSFAQAQDLEKNQGELKEGGDIKKVELEQVKHEIQINQDNISTVERKLGVLEGYEQVIPKEEEKLQAARSSKRSIDLNLKRLAMLKEAFGSKGIRSMVIDYLLPELEDKINDILSKMSEFRVALDTQQGKASGDGSKEGLFITIINDMGEEMPFENYSGGERLKIVVAITEALATLQKCGFRLFDEVWVGLDETSLESFVSVLDTLLERFPQVVCVSHLTEIKASFDEKKTITKHNGVSHVQ